MIFIFDTCFLNLSTDAAQQNLFTTSARAQESLQTFLKIVNIPILFNKTLFSERRSDSVTFVRCEPEKKLYEPTFPSIILHNVIVWGIKRLSLHLWFAGFLHAIINHIHNYTHFIGYCKVADVYIGPELSLIGRIKLNGSFDRAEIKNVI